MSAMSPRPRTPSIRTASLASALVVLASLGLAAYGASPSGLDVLPTQLPRESAELEGAMSPAGDWLMAQRAGESGAISARSYERALEQADALREQTAEVAPELADAPWSFMGPTNMGGR